jgi:protein O-GlcNAc transferase
MPQPLEALQLFRTALAAGRIEEARALEAQLPPGHPGDVATAQAWYEAGHLYAEHWWHADADRALAHAATLLPGDPTIHAFHASVRQELGDTDGALRALGAVRGEVPDLRVAVAGALMLPQVYADSDDLARWRARYVEGLETLERNARRFDAGQVFALDRGNFLLAYQGHDDLPLQQRYSRFLAGLAQRAAPQWCQPMRASFDGGRRLRVGFAGSIFRDCTAGRYFERWATGLDPRRFERIVFHTGPVSDAASARMAAGVDRFEHLRLGIRETAGRIAAERLDVLVYPEVGMDAMTYVLAALRLATLQCAGWGHPVTTGSDAIDVFLTAASMEPPQAAAHYSEELVGLPGLGVDYPLPAVPEGVARAAFGLPGDRRIYACPQSLFKIHPDMDGLFADLMQGDPSGVLVFFQATARGVTEAFARRLQRILATRRIPPRGQLKFLPRLPGRDFRALLAASDVVVDTVHWSGGNTSLDALAAGTPVVTIPGRFMRGRQTAAMLGAMGLETLVAPDLAAAARTAIEVATQPDLRRDMSSAILERRGAIFSRPEPTAALGEALLRLTALKSG